MSELEDWDDDDEMGVAAVFVLAFAAGFIFVTVSAAAIAWNAASVAAQAVQSVRRAVR